MIFKYRKEKTGLLQKNTLRPVADVFLKKENGGWFLFRPYIDSGADVTLVPYSVGLTIGLDSKKFRVETLGGISGGLKVIYTKIKMRIGEKTFDVKIAWSQTDNVPSLLGREDIFNKFKITFDERREEIIFE